MQFYVLPVKQFPDSHSEPGFYLTEDAWNDYWSFETLYQCTHVGQDHQAIGIGAVKIGQTEMSEPRPTLLPSFEELGDEFFSLGQDESYYQNLTFLGANVRETILHALRDIAYDAEIFQRAALEEVTRRSLLRSVSRVAVENRLRHLARGDAPLTEYMFRYELSSRSSDVPLAMDFHVTPASEPPSNVHVVIGRNGAGKTRLLQHMARALTTEERDTRYGKFTDSTGTETASTRLFANVVSVTFSAFDEFAPVAADDFGQAADRLQKIPYSYVGLRDTPEATSGSSPRAVTKDPLDLARDFANSALACTKRLYSNRWQRALRTLESDPIFHSANITSLLEFEPDAALTLTGIEPESQFVEFAENVYKSLSTGHKIVLLIITRLVQTVEERSLVLLDEPEAHLHPPLLSALIRALSELLISQNGVAIVATHSPVVLQEVPASCVFKLRRSGRSVAAERPEIETFAENVGVLTREVFGLEVTQSGFHRLLGNEVARGLSYEEILGSYSGRIGAEGRSIVRNLIALRDSNDGIFP